VQVTGTVSEFFGQTQISASDVTKISDGAVPLPAPTPIMLPAPGRNTNGDIEADLEAYEGMLVTFPYTLTINEMFQL
jgi:predicted extracellular nuclease